MESAGPKTLGHLQPDALREAAPQGSAFGDRVVDVVQSGEAFSEAGMAGMEFSGDFWEGLGLKKWGVNISSWLGWFGTWLDYFSIQLGISSSQLTNSYFSEG